MEEEEKNALFCIRLMKLAKWMALCLIGSCLIRMFQTHEEELIALCIIASLEACGAQWFITTWTKEMKDA